MAEQAYDWLKAWDENDIGFHRENIDAFLSKYIDRLINGRKNIKIFIPLCGKTVDIKWLWEMGHTVIGVDLAKKALEEFFKEQNISYTVSNLAEGKGEVFTSEDKRIKLYCCDLFKFNSSCEGLMDAIWDRGSLVAIEKEDRRRYAELMKSLMAEGCQYLAETLEYDETKFGGPPRIVSEQTITDLFGDKLEITHLERKDIFTPAFKEAWGIDSLFEHLYLFCLK
ncbi:probable thiopurine S-methyltransferase [Saccostrea cucullata]|uniref:probable thiopurine S-methyltransferase n=1 Tax=Saccostrea cuccullata TaxID=36930 RepID=UPI002ED09226